MHILSSLQKFLLCPLAFLALLPAVQAEKAKLVSVTIIDEQTLQVHVEEGVVEFNEDASRPSAYTDQNDLGIMDVVRYGEVVIEEATGTGTWTLSGGVMGAGVNPDQVHRKTKMNGMAQFEWQQTGDYRYEYTLEHFFYLRLPEPMQQGETYTLTIGESANIDTASVQVTYDIFEHRSEAIKLNLVGFLPDDSIKAVDLYMWMGDGGARDYSDLIDRPVHIINLDTGATQQVSSVSFWQSSAGDVAHLADASAASTTVTMPGEAISITASYTALPPPPNNIIIYTDALTEVNGI